MVPADRFKKQSLVMLRVRQAKGEEIDRHDELRRQFDGKYQCKYCGLLVDTGRDLLAHVIEVHVDDDFIVADDVHEPT
jgi:hypothetical protein